MYRLVTLTKKSEDGYKLVLDNVWVRSEIAQVGNCLIKLKDNDSGEIRNGWTVESVGNTERPESYLIAQSRSYKKTRIASDI